MSSTQNSNALSSINQKIIQAGEVLPVVKLKDGSAVQTGTVATMLHNINLYLVFCLFAFVKKLQGINIPVLDIIGNFFQGDSKFTHIDNNIKDKILF